MRPIERLAVDVFLEQTLAHHEPEMFARPPPRRIRRFIDDVAKIVEAAGRCWLIRLQPGFPRLTALPCSRREAEDLDLDAATLQCAGQNIGAGGGDRNRTAAHRSRIVDEQGHDRIAELHILLALERQRLARIGDHSRQPRRDRGCLPRGRIPRTGSAAPADASATGWRAARRSRRDCSIACRDRSEAGRVPRHRKDLAPRPPRHICWVKAL